MSSRKKRNELTPHQLLRIFTVVGGFFVLAGMFLIWMGLGEWQETRRFIARSVPASGRVVELKLRDSIGNSLRHADTSTYFPVFVFKDASGAQYHVTGRTGSNPASYDIGEEVPVLYPPKSPHEARIDSFTDLWGMATLFGGIGVPQMLLGSVVLARGVNRMRAGHKSFA